MTEEEQQTGQDSASGEAEQASLLGDAVAETGGEYRVLARKYRPQTFAEVVGQEALVRTLTNAFATNRIAHAFILTGVRGVGKTTTARLIAKGLNCVGPDGTGGVTVSPCGVCERCQAIAEDRDVDVIEMDAASRTGVDDIREILDGVRYLPVGARFKVYIIDEVHMLSRHAFNALLKTLEEPPERVKFVFATTEIRKVPVTVLSRCQRFDLRRIPTAALVQHFRHVSAAENAEVSADALRLIARAADGSARDGLSLLDQAISHSQGPVEAEQVRAMLGLADAGAVYDLFETLMRGDVAATLEQFGRVYAAGADPLVVLQDLLNLCHWLTRLRVAPDAAAEEAVADEELARSKAMAANLSVAALSRAWQILLKGVGEVQTAPAAKAAADMVLIRLAYTADLPPPGDIIKKLVSEDPGEAAPPSAAPNPTPGTTQSLEAAPPVAEQLPAVAAGPGEPVAAPKSFRKLVDVFAQRREAQLRNQLYHNVRLVRYEPGRLEFQPAELAPPDLSGRLLKCLRDWFGSQWQVSVSQSPTSELTLAEQDRIEQERQISSAQEHPVVQAALAAFPGAQIARVTPKFESETDDIPAADEAGDADDDDMIGEQSG